MLVVALLTVFSAARAELPPDIWTCTNDIEVWCSEDRCEARSTDEITPMSIHASPNGAFSVCAYTGCWEGKGKVANLGGRLLWAGDDVPFSTRPEGAKGDVSLLIIEGTGRGYVNIGPISTPLRCLRGPRPE